MTRVMWTLFSAAIIASNVVAIVRAQSDDVFGPSTTVTEVKAEEHDPFGSPTPVQPATQQPPSPTPTPVADLFVPPTADPTPTEGSANPFAPGAAQRVEGKLNDNLCRCQGDTNLAAIAKIKMALETPLRGSGFEFTDTPLEEVVNLLQDDYGIPIQIDTAALDEIGVSGDEPVNVNLRNVSLRSALRLMLKQIQLTSMIDDEVLLITTPDEADSRIKVCVYDVRDLIDANPPVALKQLSEVVTSSVSAESWVGSGGRGSVRSYPPNLLVISQPQGVHDQIQDLLKRMRQMRQVPRENGKPTATPRK